MENVFLLHCSISANVRQSTQIKFDDLKLPKSVVETLEKQQAVSVRPNLSGKLKEYLCALRIMQRKLYDSCTIHRGDVHFLHADYFNEAVALINDIKDQARSYNEVLKSLWTEEFEKWSTTVNGFLEPLFEDEVELKMAKEAYLKLFPTKAEFEAPIEVFVVGPNPINLEVATSAGEFEHKEILCAAAVNTAEVLKAAQDSAADRALEKASELLDDLDVRITAKVGDRQTGSAKRRGSWQITAEQLKLISAHCKGFDNLSSLTDELLECGRDLNAPLVRDKKIAYAKYEEVKAKIREELEAIVKRRDSSEGLETLKKSLALSNSYKSLLTRIQDADSDEQLETLEAEINTELDIYAQRSKHLQKLFEQRKEFVQYAKVGLDEAIKEVQAIEVASVEDCDF